MYVLLGLDDSFVPGEEEVLVLPRESCPLEPERGGQVTLHLVCHLYAALTALGAHRLQELDAVLRPRVHEEVDGVQALGER